MSTLKPDTACALRRLASPVVPFLAGAALDCGITLLSGAQQRSGGDDDKPGTESSFAGPPKVTDSGSDSSFKGPPPQAGAGQAPTGTGFNNPGGAIDPTALQAAAASGGIRFHSHYHGVQGQAPMAGYAPTTFVNPANLPSANTASQYMPGYGPGDPGPLGSAAGEVNQPFVGSHTYTGGGPGGYFGGSGAFGATPMAVNTAYANAGYVAGFND
mgnify:CR=1 FL=1